MSNVIPFPVSQTSRHELRSLYNLILHHVIEQLASPQPESAKREIYARLLRGHVRRTQGEITC